jgi:hypothetical protein
MDKSVVRIRHDCTSVMNAYSLGYSAADNSFVQQNIINLFVAVAMKQSLAAFSLHAMIFYVEESCETSSFRLYYG